MFIGERLDCSGKMHISKKSTPENLSTHSVRITNN